jgi:hypothetical protein
VIEARLATWHALDQLARTYGCTLHELAEEAFRDVLRKHGQPTSLREALRQSARQLPANDHENGPVRRRS